MKTRAVQKVVNTSTPLDLKEWCNLYPSLMHPLKISDQLILVSLSAQETKAMAVKFFVRVSTMQCARSVSRATELNWANLAENLAASTDETSLGQDGLRMNLPQAVFKHFLRLGSSLAHILCHGFTDKHTYIYIYWSCNMYFSYITTITLNNNNHYS